MTHIWYVKQFDYLERNLPRNALTRHKKSWKHIYNRFHFRNISYLLAESIDKTLLNRYSFVVDIDMKIKSIGVQR